MTAKKPTTPQQGIHWNVTRNNYTKKHEALFDRPELFKYAIFGRERGEKKDTPHLQGYVALWKKKKHSAMLKLFPGFHFEICRGTPAQNRAYCIKEGDYVEYGDLPLTGADSNKKNWDLAKQLAIAGKIDDVPANIYVPYIKNLEHIQARHRPTVKSLDILFNEWHWGPTGTLIFDNFIGEIIHFFRYWKKQICTRSLPRCLY